MSRRLLNAYHESHVKKEQKPCPFCGNTLPEEFAVRREESVIKFTDRPDLITDYYSFSCSCGAQGPHGYTKEEAYNNWNRRK